jgi:hypothetical protein
VRSERLISELYHGLLGKGFARKLYTRNSRGATVDNPKLDRALKRVQPEYKPRAISLSYSERCLSGTS